MVSLNSTAAIAATGLMGLTLGHYLINMIHASIKGVQKKHGLSGKHIKVWWVPGHKNVKGNEKATRRPRRW